MKPCICCFVLWKSKAYRIPDHVLGRPSSRFRKYQVLAVVSFWSLYLFRYVDLFFTDASCSHVYCMFNRGNKHGPPGIRAISSRLSGRLTPWQAMVMTILGYYVSRNFAKIVGLECPEPLANLYSRSYFRATWITTALDAGFWTAMKIKPKWLRDLASIVFSIYYLIAAEQADEKVRRVRATITVDHLRVSWNKATTPYLSALAKLVRPRLTNYPPRAIRIPRPRQSSYKEPVDAWLYFDGPVSALKDQTCVVLDIPGGGFVAMNPRTSDDKLLAWAGKTGVPVLSIDYKKAPEYPYPYALNECYDVYHTIVTSRGRCLGLSGKTRPRIVITGESAGGNLAAGLILMVLQQSSNGDPRAWKGEEVIPPPEGLVLVYPALDMNIGCWMTEEQLSLIRDKGMRKTNRNVLQRKSEDYYKLTPSTPRPSDDGSRDISPVRNYPNHKTSGKAESSSKLTSGKMKARDIDQNQPRQIKTRLAVSSMISYFNDRILSPEMMRAMIILYIGPHNRPDFSTDFLLSPILAPEALLARFPKTYILTGERDPLVDDTVIFAGRLRQAKLHKFRERQELGLEKSHVEFDEKEHVEVTLIPGISHGFLQFAGFFPDGWKHIYRCARWIQELFAKAEVAELKKSASSRLRLKTYDGNSCSTRNGSVHVKHSRLGLSNNGSSARHHRRSLTGESSGDEDRPLEMRIGKFTPLRPLQADGTINGDNNASSSSSTTSSDSYSSARTGQEDPSSSSPSSPLVTSADDRKRDSQTKPPRTPPGAAACPFSLDLSLSINEEEEEEDPYDTDSPQTPIRRSRKRNKSLTSLPSEEDLLHRRMSGLAGGLMGIGEGARTP